MNISKTKVRTIMDKRGISTYTELAAIMGITKNQLSTMLSTGYEPLKIKVQNLCEALNVEPEDIMEWNPSDMRQASFSGHNSIELFAGAGGLALGLEKAGFNHVALVENDKDCCETLRSNRKNWNVIEGDIHDVSFKEYTDVELVTGGFPCQAFSYAGKKLGLEDTRGTLFYEFARCVSETRPKIFMAENVRGLKSHDKGRTLDTIIAVFRHLGYNVKYQVLNAAYYGVGQKRERIVIVGIREDYVYNFVFPVPDETMTVLRDVLKNCPPSLGAVYSDKKKRVFELVPPGGSWVNLPEDVAKEYMGKSYYSGGGKRGMARRISWDEPCLTLTCSPSQKQTDRCHPDEVRPFTIRESARIQSFPDEWLFCGGISSQYKQIGNAVPVEMARRIGVALMEALTSLEPNS